MIDSNSDYQAAKRVLAMLRNGGPMQLEEQVAFFERTQEVVNKMPSTLEIEQLGIVLSKLRRSRGVTQRDIGMALNVHETAISRLEADQYKGMKLERLIQFFAVLGIKATLTLDNIKAVGANAPE